MANDIKENKMKEFKIKETVLQSMLNYLATRPYQEVVQLIAEIQRAEIIIENNNKKEVIERNGKPKIVK